MTEYETLVNRVNEEWNHLHGHAEPVSMERAPVGSACWDWETINNEINLWTYWQGSLTHQAEIMLVGQDWGNPGDSGNEKVYDNIMNGRNYLENIEKTYPTDRNLIDLFAELIRNGEKLFPHIDTEKYPNLFFTNFCLGYRLGSSSGGMTRKQMMKDEEYFLELVRIVDPKIIITLGRNTYECVVSAVTQTDFRHEKASDFWRSLDDGTNVKEGKVNGHKLVMFGMAHPGSYGTNVNRRKYSQKGQTNSGRELMIEDWKRINLYL